MFTLRLISAKLIFWSAFQPSKEPLKAISQVRILSNQRYPILRYFEFNQKRLAEIKRFSIAADFDRYLRWKKRQGVLWRTQEKLSRWAWGKLHDFDGSKRLLPGILWQTNHVCCFTWKWPIIRLSHPNASIDSLKIAIDLTVVNF